MKIIKKWVTIALAEIILSLVLLAIAPVFLNSNKPIFGFLIWLGVPSMLGASGVYVALKVTDARKARMIFISKFPEYSYLDFKDFLEIPANHVSQNMPILEAAKDDPDFQSLNISLLDILKGENSNE